MNPELRELYQEVILDHSKKPRNFGKLEAADGEAKGHNPLCGDRVTVFVKREGDRIKDVQFDGAGCAICMASASMMTERVQGQSESDADELGQAFHALVTGSGSSGGSNYLDLLSDDQLGKLVVFAGVREFPMRVKCATLAWHTLRAALNDADEVSTE